MKRALQLSLHGGPRVSPNPFVGAVIAARGRVIGEGYHRCYGEAHAEVNAVNSVNKEDSVLLKEATMYVTLEPCSHFGKTPPCADLVVRTGIPRVVVAAEDPFLSNHESGIGKMRQAGIDVEVGLMREEARFINRRFFTAHELRRPFILLKWAQSADGFIAAKGGKPVTFSSPFTKMMMHRERAFYDAIMVGTHTVISDNPRLDCRLWPCHLPGRPVKLSFNSQSLPANSLLMQGHHILKDPDESIKDFMHRLYEQEGITSVMVEGGAHTLESFLHEYLFDEIRIETAPFSLGDGVKAPDPLGFILDNGLMMRQPIIIDNRSITYFVKNY